MWFVWCFCGFFVCLLFLFVDCVDVVCLVCVFVVCCVVIVCVGIACVALCVSLLCVCVVRCVLLSRFVFLLLYLVGLCFGVFFVCRCSGVAWLLCCLADVVGVSCLVGSIACCIVCCYVCVV